MKVDEFFYLRSFDTGSKPTTVPREDNHGNLMGDERLDGVKLWKSSYPRIDALGFLKSNFQCIQLDLQS